MNRTPRMRNLRHLFFLLLALPLMLSAETPKPEVHGDWLVQCAGAGQPCRMIQTQHITRDETRSRVLHASVSRDQKGQAVLQLILPLGVALPPGLVLRVDEGEVFNVPYQTCLGEGCVALFPLPDARLDLFRKGHKARIGFRPLQSDQTLVVEMSLKGFSRASGAI